MSENDGREEPRTAAEEVLREVEEAGRRTRDDSADSRHRGEAGEAGEAITPNTEAQEESQGEQ
ncbi:hypothetical protein ACE1N8_33300 (plasmid) [Streptomyces sp. DSM 116494]|uniref:hypothetical protein n=1 Tax=Streptomyces okerensis TaxID=3344655 RepID=UPI00388FAE15